jgi:phage terminase large subunit
VGAAETIAEWRKSPLKFVRDNFHIEPDAWQVEALEALGSTDKNKSRISLQACAGPGKSALLAWAGLWFLTCMASKGQHPKGAVVAVTRDNLKDNIFPELSKWMNRSPFLLAAFEWTKERLSARDFPQTWFLSARSWSKTADEEEQGRTLSGLHSEYVLYLIDESGDIPVAVLKAAEQGLSNCVWGKIIQAGNGTSSASQEIPTIRNDLRALTLIGLGNRYRSMVAPTPGSCRTFSESSRRHP